MIYDALLESDILPLDTVVDEYMDAQSELLYQDGMGGMLDCLIPDSVVDSENDNTDYDKYLGEE